jgi:hypothetical protein
MATPEKALCDKIVFTKNAQITTLIAMNYFLMDDLSIDFQNIKQLNVDVFKASLAVAYKHKDLVN